MFESLQQDQRECWQRGDRVTVQSYIAMYPALASDELALTDLVCSEVALRQAHGESPSLDDYVNYPQCAEALRKQFTRIQNVSWETVRNSEVPMPSQHPSLFQKPTPSASQAPFVSQTPSDNALGLGTINNDFATIQAESQGELLVTHQADIAGYPRIPGFEILGELGRGGMGIVYRAKQISANRIVALKIVRNELLDAMPMDTRTSTLERFRTEAQAAAHLQHDNLVSVYEIGEVPSGIPGACPLRYYAMRFVQGRSLFDIVRDGPLENRRAANYMAPVARALQAAHEQGILHRDLKPHNIMVDGKSDRPLVTDFGLAKFVEGQDALTYAGEIMGTPSYMSPEQAQDAGKVTASADLYSLGATLYHLLTGRAPFQASNIAETIRQLIDKEPVALRQLNASIDRDLETICLKCLRKNPAGRYASCAALADDLELYLSGRPIIARPVGRIERVWRWCQRNPIPAVLTGTAIALSFATMLSIVIGYRNTTAALAVSESRLQQALQVVDELFTRVSEDELLNEPGMQPLRKDLLEKALKHYQYFLTESGGKEALREEVASSHFRVGLISQTLGEFETALSELSMARNIQEKLLNAHPDDLRRLKALADTFNALGSLYNSKHQFDLSSKMFHESTTVRERLVALQSNNIEFKRLLANSIMNLGLAKVEDGNPEEGILDMREAQSSRQANLNDNPESGKMVRDSAMGWYMLGKTEMAQNRFEAAIDHFEDAIREFQVLVKRDPRSMSNRYYLGVSYRLKGSVLAEKKETAAAVEAFEAATKTIQSLATANPDVAAYQAELAVLAMNRGTGYFDSDDMVRSKQAWQEARTLNHELLMQDPSNPDHKGDLAASLGALGNIERLAGNIDAARALFEDAQTRLGELLKSYPHNEWYKSQMEENKQDLEELAKPALPKPQENEANLPNAM
ncbi:MAG: protein kinase [Pirellula sp.]